MKHKMIADSTMDVAYVYTIANLNLFPPLLPPFDPLPPTRQCASLQQTAILLNNLLFNWRRRIAIE